MSKIWQKYAEHVLKFTHCHWKAVSLGSSDDSVPKDALRFLHLWTVLEDYLVALSKQRHARNCLPELYWSSISGSSFACFLW